MVKTDYPCRKCLQNIPDNMDCICCDICDNWLHVNCSGLTFKKFKKISKDLASVWYCTLCIKDVFPFGYLDNKKYIELHTLKPENKLDDLITDYIKKNKFNLSCSVCTKNSKPKSTLPCSICKKLIHKRCSKEKGKLTKLTTIINWTCDVYLQEIFPFHICTNKQFKDEHKLQKMDLDININKIRNEYNYLYMINETIGNDDTENDICKYHCDYYDLKELQKITPTLTKKRISIIHTNISSLQANFDKLHSLLSRMPITFDIISLTEVWKSIDKIDRFNPNDIEGYYKYNGIPGKTKNSGSGFYIKDKTKNSGNGFYIEDKTKNSGNGFYIKDKTKNSGNGFYIKDKTKNSGNGFYIKDKTKNSGSGFYIKDKTKNSGNGFYIEDKTKNSGNGFYIKDKTKNSGNGFYIKDKTKNSGRVLY